ncbi:MAG TPA: hypothetical protein VEY12_00030 [Thermoplasmata archaeon]|nr:hypothetical protein [Thermoplasmata archaeon]
MGTLGISPVRAIIVPAPAAAGTPNLTITNPVPNAAFRVRNVTVSWVADGNGSKLAGFTVQLGGLPPVDVGLNTNYSLVGLDDGLWLVRVRATNAAGLTATRSVGFFVVTHLGSMSLQFVSSAVWHQGVYILATRTVVVVWDVLGAYDGLASATLTVDGSPYPLSWVPHFNASTPPILGNGSVFTIPIPLEGIHTIILTAEDRAGNSMTFGVPILVDPFPPTAKIAAPADGATVSGPDVSLVWEARSNLSGISGYAVAVDVPGDNSYVTDAYNNTTVLRGLNPGQHRVYLTVDDWAGHEVMVSTTFTVTAPSQPPLDPLLILPWSLAAVLAIGVAILTQRLRRTRRERTPSREDPQGPPPGGGGERA